MFAALCLPVFLTTEHSSATGGTEGRNPFGMKMCEELCASYGDCVSPLYLKRDLVCYLHKSNVSLQDSGIERKVEMEKNERHYYRRIFSKSRATVFVQRTNCRNSVQRKVSPGYITLKAGKDIITVKRYETKMSWSSARDVCRSEGGDLVKVDTKKKQAEISRAFSRTEDIMARFSLWIGLTDQNGENEYRWTDGCPLEYANWFTKHTKNTERQKDDTGVKGHCVCMNQLLVVGMHWRDSSCDTPNGFICERPFSHCRKRHCSK